MVTSFLLVCKVRESGSLYVSSTLYESYEFQKNLIYLDSIGVDVLDVIPVQIDLSKYAH